VPSWTKVLNSDQIRDDSTGNVYAIEDVTRPPTLITTHAGGREDLVLTLRRVTASGI
jgi:hypothetical protein